jgi:hypothetical protein
MQTIPITGVTSDMRMIVDAMPSGVASEAVEQLEAWGMVSKISIGNDEITVICFEEKPGIAIPIQLMAVI